jgi:signal peptidase I
VSEESTGAAEADANEAGKQGERVKRSPRHVKAAARILQKEARKILAKHARRLAAEPAEAIQASVAAIDDLRRAQDWDRLEEEAERLDELLHQHADFARKSALRETVENISVAILIALGLRSCFYEPFKIPSGSMMPTLLAGDHIFVNKFVYGVQIPFTTTVVGKGIGEIERGDVIVFRYPLDQSEDFIKRVVGLPGDEVKVSGRKLELKRAGEDEFEIVPRERLSSQCIDDLGRVEPNCTLYEETLDGNTYVVRYSASLDDRGDSGRSRVVRVPEDHLLVLGDNRNQSHDSLAWKEEVEAVSAENLLTIKDLRDLTRDQDFSLSRPDDDPAIVDPKHDRVTYLSIHRSRRHDMELSVWRQPVLGARNVFDAVASRIEDGEAQTMEGLLEGRGAPTGADRDRVLTAGEGIDAMVAGRSGDALAAVVLLESADAVLWLQCGRRVCRHPAQLAVRVAEMLAAFARDHEQDARGLLVQPRDVRYSHHWTGRSDASDHLHERSFTKPGAEGRRASVRLRAFRKPNEGVEVLRDAALIAVGSSAEVAAGVPDLGSDAWLVEDDAAWSYVGVDPVRDMVVLLECGKAACPNREQAISLARTVQGRVPRAASDRRKLAEILVSEDVSGWPEIPQPSRDRHEFDRVRLEGTVRGKDHALEIEVWLEPADGITAKLGLLQTELALQPDDTIVAGGLARHTPKDHTFVFPVHESDTVVRVSCRTGLCTDEETAVAMARRAASKATDRTAFIDPHAERPRPFVPRGNVKGRAERIWLPLSRFWLPIR